MNEEALRERSERTHAIVEGALLGDIAIVFLLMRAYLPVLFVRPILAAFAAVPIVLLTQRRGVKLAVLAAVASYILFSGLVGPFLAIAALNAAVAGILIGVGRRFGLSPALNTLLAGPLYAVLVFVIPTIASVIVFRYPVKKLITGIRHLLDGMFHLFIFIAGKFNTLLATLHLSALKISLRDLKAWEHGAVNHWQIVWLAATVLSGIATMYLIAFVSHVVLTRLPREALVANRSTA